MMFSSQARKTRILYALADLLPSWAPIAFIGLAVLFLGVGILNVLWVRHALAGYRASR